MPLLLDGARRGHHFPGDGAIHERTGHTLHVEAKLQGVSKLRPARRAAILPAGVGVDQIAEALHAPVVGVVGVHVRSVRNVVKLA